MLQKVIRLGNDNNASRLGGYRNPARWYTALTYLVGLGWGLPWGQSPLGAPRQFLVQLPISSHQHLHDGDPDEIAVFTHVALSCNRPCCHLSQDFFRSIRGSAAAYDTVRGGFGGL